MQLQSDSTVACHSAGAARNVFINTAQWLVFPHKRHSLFKARAVTKRLGFSHRHAAHAGDCPERHPLLGPWRRREAWGIVWLSAPRATSVTRVSTEIFCWSFSDDPRGLWCAWRLSAPWWPPKSNPEKKGFWMLTPELTTQPGGIQQPVLQWAVRRVKANHIRHLMFPQSGHLQWHGSPMPILFFDTENKYHVISFFNL